MRTWIDENTGREVRQLTDAPGGCGLGYYVKPRYAGQEFVIAVEEGGSPRQVLVHVETGEVTPSPLRHGQSILQYREPGGPCFFRMGEREVGEITLPDGEARAIAELPADAPGRIFSVTCDGRFILLHDRHDPHYDAFVFPDHCDADAYWAHVERPRNGRLWSYDTVDGAVRLIVDVDGVMPGGIQTSPTDPKLVKYNYDGRGLRDHHLWLARVDAGEPWKVRPQREGDMVMHAFWCADGQHVGYKWQDRSRDETYRDTPYGEYSTCPTHVCLAGMDGKEVFRSDPLAHWHTHIIGSRDGRWLSGEGTHDYTFIYAAPFSIDSTRIDFVPLATWHTKYEAFRGQEAEAGFSYDGKWLLYNDTIDGRKQVCAVAVDL